MALIQEDGTGLTNSQTYATDADLTAYAALRGITISGTNEQLLMRAMDYIEQQSFKGTKGSSAQALQWPRVEVYIDSYSVSDSAIPTLLKEAQMEAALAIDAGDDPLSTIDREAKKETLGELSVEYMDNALSAPILRKVKSKLSKLLSTGSVFAVRV